MRLKVAESAVEIPGPRLHIHNVSQGDRNRNQQDKLQVSTDLNSTQWASNYVTSPNATLLKDHLTNNGSNFNNNITVSLQQQQQLQQQQLQQRRTSYSASSDLLSASSPDDSLGDYDADAQHSSSSLDASPQGDEYRCFSHDDDVSDSDSLSDDGNCHSESLPCAAPLAGRGIVNPNYPGFQHLAHRLQRSDIDDLDDDVDVADASDNNNLYNNNDNNNNNGDDDDAEDNVDGEDVAESKIDSINHKDSIENFQKAFYDKPKFNIPVDGEEDLVSGVPVSSSLELVSELNVPVVEVIASSAEVENLETSVIGDGDLGIDADCSSSSECPDEVFIESVFADIENLVTALDDVHDIEYSVGVAVVGKLVTALPAEETRVSCVANAHCVVVSQEIIPHVVDVEDEIFTAIQDEEFVSSLSTNAWADEDFVDIVLSEKEENVEVLKSAEEHFIGQSVEDIETAFSDVELNETIFADLESIKSAFADNANFGCNKISDCEHIIPPAPAFLNHAFEVETKDIILSERVDSASVTPTMAATAITAPTGEPKQIPGIKMEDAFLSNAKEDLPGIDVVINCDPSTYVEKKVRCLNEKLLHGDSNRAADDREKFMKEEQSASEKEKEDESAVPRKKEKMEINYNMKKIRHSIGGGGGGVKGVAEMTLPLNMTGGGGGVVRRREFGPRGRDIMLANRRSMPVGRDKKRSSPEILGGFDVYNIETAMPKIDLDAIESHLKAAREEDRRRRNDREEIRKRLAMGSDADEYYGGERPGRKPSLQARLQSGMNLQICFMNETVSDTESPGSDTEPSTSPVKHHIDKAIAPRSFATPLKSPSAAPAPGTRTRPSTSMLTLPLRREPDLLPPMTEADFFARQARLQAEARMALAQAKEMAHMQMEIERQRQKKSPITEMVRSSLEKVGIPFPEDRRRVSRQILTEMNLAQLQVIVNDLHTQIEVLNESLVKFLMNRDDLHMEQDSMLVDIEDLTRYLGAKEHPLKGSDQPQPLLPQNNNLLLLTSKPKLNRVAGMVKK